MRSSSSNRRRLAVLAIFVLGTLAPSAVAGADNPITVENAQPGTTDWELGVSPVSTNLNQIRGYANRTSVTLGKPIDFKVTVNPAQNYTIDVYRLGWYGGLGGRLMQSIGPLAGMTKPSCPKSSSTGLIACNWSTDYVLDVPSDWTTGFYLAKLHNAAGYVSYINFVVRDDASHSDIFVQQSTNTWQAYNSWGGASLYPPGSTHAVKVSYDRPYMKTGSWYHRGEINLVRWLEQNGYDVSYTTDVDTHSRGSLIRNHKVFIESWHDEYWSWEMRDAVEAARDAGVNLMFLGGNESYWQIRYQSNTAGFPYRVIVGYKEQYKEDPYLYSSDPAKRRRTTTLFRASVVNRPEQLMMGTMYGYNIGTRTDIPYTVKSADNWIYEGTGVTNGQQLTRIVGREFNRVYYAYPLPRNQSFTIVAETIDSVSGKRANSVLYQAPSGAWVFSAGTMDWNWALDDYGSHGRVSPELQQAMANMLSRFIGGG